MTGIAALLLPGGTTSHSRLGIPLQLDTDPISGFFVQSGRAAVLRQASIVVIDEATMAEKKMFALLDTLFRDLM